MNVSAIVNYYIEDPVAATYAVTDVNNFVMNQGLEVIRRVCAQFPYRSSFGQNEPSLMADSQLIGEYMKGLVQDRCMIAGVKIIKMELMEIAYHVEVAQSLLQVQQAAAKVDARNLIVQGSVQIVNEAIENLNKRGIELTKQGRSDLVKKMLVVTCSDHGNP